MPIGGGWRWQVTETCDGEDAGFTGANSGLHDGVLEVLLSQTSRSILASTTERAKSIEEISADSGIPVSTCYERVAALMARGVVRRERTLIRQSGKKYALYRATVRRIQVELGVGGIDILTVANKHGFEEPNLRTRPFASNLGPLGPYPKAMVRRKLPRA